MIVGVLRLPTEAQRTRVGALVVCLRCVAQVPIAPRCWYGGRLRGGEVEACGGVPRESGEMVELGCGRGWCGEIECDGGIGRSGRYRRNWEIWLPRIGAA